MPGENQKVIPSQSTPLYATSNIQSIHFIPETPFQKVCAYVKYASSLPKWSELKILSSYCKDKPRVSVSTAASPRTLVQVPTANWEPSTTHIPHSLVEGEQDCCNKTPTWKKEELKPTIIPQLKLSSHPSVEQFFLEQLSGGTFMVYLLSLQHQKRTMAWLLCLSWLLQQLVL